MKDNFDKFAKKMNNKLTYEIIFGIISLIISLGITTLIVLALIKFIWG